MEDKKIVGRFIVSVMSNQGKEKTKEFSNQLIEEIKKNYKVLNSSIVSMEQVGERTWKSFIELEVEFPGFIELLKFIVDYVPNTVEIIEPDRLELTITELQDAMFELASWVGSIHQFTATLYYENKVLKERMARLYEALKKTGKEDEGDVKS